MQNMQVLATQPSDRAMPVRGRSPSSCAARVPAEPSVPSRCPHEIRIGCSRHICASVPRAPVLRGSAPHRPRDPRNSCAKSPYPDLVSAAGPTGFRLSSMSGGRGAVGIGREPSLVALSPPATGSTPSGPRSRSSAWTARAAFRWRSPADARGRPARPAETGLRLPSCFPGWPRA